MNEDILLQNTDMDQSENDKSKKQKKKGKVLVQRSEASQNISEFNLNEVGREKVKLNELIKSSQKLSGQDLVKKQLNNAKKLQSLSVPLSKPQLQKIKRGIAYEKVCNEVAKWEPIVKNNRVAEQTIYPLKKPQLRLDTFENVAESFISKHPVEIAVNELLKKSENILDGTQTLTVAEEKALKAMSPEEAKLRHNELMKHRALISYQEAKARRQNKIKSKRYHRMLKKEKIKNMMKEFEELKETDKAAALEKLMEADKVRILERMTLKHKNTGKWAKVQKLRAKYNPESRSALKEDILVGRQLREKIAIADKTMEDLKSSAVEIDEADFSIYDSGLIEETNNNEDTEMSFAEVHAEKLPPHNEFTISKEIKSILSFSNNNEETDEKSAKPQNKPKIVPLSDTIQFAEAQNLDSLVPDGINLGDEDLDDGPEGTVNIAEAFADEDLIAEFREDKKTADKANRIDGIDLYLPGWGSWGGPDIKDSKRKRKRFFIKPVEKVKKKSSLGNIILNEDKDKKAAIHQVSQLPFPFSNVHQFESYIRQPVGHTWNPQSSFQNLIAPKIVTKMGKIIEPIDAEDVVLKKDVQKLQPNVRKKLKKIKQTPQAF